MLNVLNSLLVVVIICITYAISHLIIKDKIIKSYGLLGNLSDEFRSQKLDVVYLWVDMDDPEWRIKKYGTPLVDPDPNNYRELEFSVKSTIKYMKDILGTIYIVTDNQIPKWLELSPYKSKIKIIDHAEILPREFIPCFNSNVIEAFLYNIVGVSDWFLYMNDDMFINDYVRHDAFFVADKVARFSGSDGIIFNNAIVSKVMSHNPHTTTICRSFDIYRKMEPFIDPYYTIKGHTPNIINKQILHNLVNRYQKHIKKGTHLKRTKSDLNITQFIYPQYMYNNKLGVYSNDYTYMYLDYWTNIKKNEKAFSMIDKTNPTFFVVNERHTTKNMADNIKITKSLVDWLDGRLS